MRSYIIKFYPENTERYLPNVINTEQLTALYRHESRDDGDEKRWLKKNRSGLPHQKGGPIILTDDDMIDYLNNGDIPYSIHEDTPAELPQERSLSRTQRVNTPWKEVIVELRKKPGEWMFVRTSKTLNAARVMCYTTNKSSPTFIYRKHKLELRYEPISEGRPKGAQKIWARVPR